MRSAVLEGRVLAVIDSLRSGVSPEDDFTKRKDRWPDRRTARQLVGLCNQAAGEVAIYIIGVREPTGEIVDPGALDPTDWWAGIRGQFDETPPDVLLHLVVAVGTDQYVHAYAFDTSRAPYVVKSDDSKLDVPMRDSTGTRSAHRHELLRLLLPSAKIPPAILLSGKLTAGWKTPAATETPASSGDSDSGIGAGDISGNITCFIEHLGPDHIMLPLHEMGGKVQV